MRFSVEWVGDGRNAVLEERATVADLTIDIDGEIATKHTIGKTVETGVRVATFGLADGIAHDWWALFGGRDRQTSVLKYREGYILPDLRFLYNGEAFEVESGNISLKSPDVVFWRIEAKAVSREAAESGLSQFVEAVIAKLRRDGLDDTSLEERWKRVSNSRADSGEREFCEAAGALSLDPYRVDEAYAEIIESAAKLFQGEALLEFLSGVRGRSADEIRRSITAIQEVQGYRTKLPKLREVAELVAQEVPRRASEPSWATGYRRAEVARRQFHDSRSAAGVRTMAEWFGAPKNSFQSVGSVRGVSALRRDIGRDIHIGMRNSTGRDQASRRFVFARALGDAFCFPDGGTSPINHLKHASRQSAGRAFAAQFLAPLGVIQEMRSDGQDMVEIANHLGVALEVVERQCENSENIKRALAA